MRIRLPRFRSKQHREGSKTGKSGFIWNKGSDSNGEWQGIYRSNGKPLRSINGRIRSTPDSAHYMEIKRIPG